MEDYSTLEAVYNFFNKKLFDSQLPEAIITLTRKQKCMGYYSPERFEKLTNKKIKKDEISMNPDHFHMGMREACQTMLHEMCHQWQQHFGTRKSRPVYHNKEWGDKMEEVGLMPSDTSRPGGKRTGQKMADYPIEGGQFLKLMKELESKKLIWEGVSKKKPKPPKRIFKYTCPECEQVAWAKIDAAIKCGDCDTQMEII